ncbi:transforming growth factor, beta receptor associated protein 1 [Borealophlyctis nickersoniae]|nr:transforming growth factor, beta receptor associated protein 1 [Borealophlyctis nickersoniae]
MGTPLPLSIAKRRSMLCVQIGDSLSLDKEVPLLEGAISMVRFGPHVCAADQQQYKMVHIETGDNIPLFPYDRVIMRPVIAAISQREFLLVTATPQGVGLGMFITSSGDPEPWNGRQFRSLWFPYVAALLKNNVIEVHNLFSQQRIQTILLPASLEPRFLVEASSSLEMKTEDSRPTSSIRILVGCKESILGLQMTSLEGQVEELLEKKMVDQAVKLAEQVAEGLSNENAENKRAGLIYLADTLFEEALSLFQKGQTDPRILISLFPDVAGPQIPTTPSDTPTEFGLPAHLTNIDDIVTSSLERNYPDADAETISSFRAALVANAKELLEKYLLYARDHKVGTGRREEIDTVLLKIYADSDPPAMYRLLAMENYCQLEESERYLIAKEKYYAVSLLYKYNALSKKTLETWMRIASGEVTDKDFPGLGVMVDFLANESDKELLWRYGQWVLRQDSALGVQMFIDWKGPPLQANDVLEYLAPFGKPAVRTYLEHLIYTLGSQDEQRHSFLAITYVEEVSELADDDALAQIENDYHLLDPRPPFLTFLRRRTDRLSTIRSMLLSFLQSSDRYHVPTIATKLSDLPNLHAERAVVFGKTGNHEMVLQILVHSLRDHIGAEQYCLGVENLAPLDSVQTLQPAATPLRSIVSRPEVNRTKPNLLLMLLRLYLKSEYRDNNVQHVMRLLNAYPSAFDIIQVNYGGALSRAHVWKAH